MNLVLAWVGGVWVGGIYRAACSKFKHCSVTACKLGHWPSLPKQWACSDQAPVRLAEVTPKSVTWVACAAAATCDTPESLHITIRSEEHTSELQSRGHIVCGL